MLRPWLTLIGCCRRCCDLDGVDTVCGWLYLPTLMIEASEATKKAGRDPLTAFRIAAKHQEQLKQQAVNRGLSISELIRQSLRANGVIDGKAS